MNVRQDPRLAGEVSRYHTWPHVRQTSVGEHSWQLARIVLAINPDADRRVLIYTIFHDIGEIGTGDVPFPVKMENPILKKEMNRVEENTRLNMCIPWGVPAPIHLSQADTLLVKFAEYIEMWEWGAKERMMGNLFGHDVEVRCRDMWFSILSAHQDADWQLRARDYLRRRYKEWSFLEECPL